MTATAVATPPRTKALIGALTLLVAGLALCADRVHNGDLYLNLLTGRFISAHGLVDHDPFPTIAHGGQWLNGQWLSEVAFFRVFEGVGLTGLSVLYALLLAAPLALLLWCCRHKGALMMAAVSAFYFPGLLAVIHPRAAGFTVLGFSLLVLLLVAAWQLVQRRPGRIPWTLIAVPVLFAAWANLHGGFVAGLLLIGLVTAGCAVDRLRGRPWVVGSKHLAALVLAGAAALLAVTVGTPLGGNIWAYLLSFRNPEISLGSKEWGPALASAPSVIYLLCATAFSLWLWWRGPRPLRLMPLLVGAGFLVFAASSARNIVFIGPAIALQVVCCAPDRPTRGSHRLGLPAAVAGSAAIAAIAVWAGLLGPPHQEGHLGSRTVAYALRHPPSSGRIVAYAGVDSYILWRSPRTPVVIDGWLEHFSPAELRGTYGLLRGWHRDPSRLVRRFQVGAVIAHLPRAIRALRRHGFVARYVGPEDTYLVRRDLVGSG
jgi:hypothetical protein